MKTFDTRVVSSWSKFYREYQKLPQAEDPKKKQWIFRGVSRKPRKKPHELASKLERTLIAAGLELKKDGDRIEGGLLRKFQRQCHHYSMKIPEEENILEWLALMQHFGAPTRLLDWTYSFFVAFYFAIERASANGECSVWALNTVWVTDRLKEKHREVWELMDTENEDNDRNIEKRSTFNKLFRRGKKMVVPISPRRLNERLVIQQGTFLCPGDISASFWDNLDALRRGTDFEGNLIKFKFKYSLSEKQKILRELHRMNMTRATLFPGLDGFAGSLETLVMTLPKILVPDAKWLANE